MTEEAAIAIPPDAGSDEVEVATFGAIAIPFVQFLNADFLCLPHGARKGRNERGIKLFRATNGQQR